MLDLVLVWFDLRKRFRAPDLPVKSMTFKLVGVVPSILKSGITQYLIYSINFHQQGGKSSQIDLSQASIHMARYIRVTYTLALY